ncbi:hypothetical protein SPAR62_0773 [Streptococcus pneumoniae GA40028]|nr:hypothetical protein SPAR91_0823 [Streptococcus pneumoniae GA47283]EHZ39847.1 hypothetical protein SPAR62_0773 [Streptococcus pneumoniae GA40028]EHZ97747.1 hypothetical protein SPAR142_0649 [Streptococcus pneumoniae NP141]
MLESDSQLTYYWTFLSGKAENQAITLYHHDQRRSGLVVQEFRLFVNCSGLKKS